MEIKVTCKGQKYIPIEQLKDFQGGLKKLSKEAEKKLERSIIKYGFSFPVFVWQNKILDGHQRIFATKQLLKQGYTIEDIPIVEIDAKNKKIAAEKLLVLNSHYAKITQEGLEGFASDFDLDLSDLVDNLDLPEVSLDLQFEDKKFIDEDDIPEEPETPVSKVGDLWLLGKHRILCGDATKQEDVNKLVDGQVIDMVFIDPPYNVAYEGGQIAKERVLKGQKKPIRKKIINDDMNDQVFYKFLFDSYSCLFNVTKPGGCIYITHSESEGVNFRKALIDSGFYFKQCLIWVKHTATLSRQDYNWQHEPVLYGWKPGAAHYFCENYTLTTIIREEENINKMEKEELVVLLNTIFNHLKTTTIEVDKPNKSPEHPTMKPVVLVRQLIENSSRKGENIIDTFLGSGSTLIACEECERVCYGLEMEPIYIDVILQRWANFTNKDPVREDGKLFSELKSEY